MVRLFLATLALAALPHLAAAQSPLTLAGVTVQRYDTLPNFSGDTGVFCCASHVNESGPDADFIHVTAAFDVAFSDTLDRVSVSSSDILLMLPGAAEGLRAVGRFSHVPVFEYGSQTINARRPRDWPNETEQGFLSAVWLVPNAAASAVLQIGEEGARLDVPLDLAVAPSAPLSPRQVVSVRVIGTEFLDSATISDRSANMDMPGVIQPRQGRFLRLTLGLTPLMSTDTDAQAGENQFFLYGNYLGVTGPDGMPLNLVGTEAVDSLRTRWSISASWDDTPREIDVTNVYLAAGGPGRYSIYFLSDKVAEFVLE